MQESLGRGRELDIDITAAFYAIALMQVFPRNESVGEINEYSGITEEIYSKIREINSNKEHVYLYDQVGDVLCFLEKADSKEELEKNIEEGINKIKDLMTEYADRIFFISVGKPVERIRDVNRSYVDASRKFAERFMCDDSRIFFGDEDETGDKIGESLKAEKDASSDSINMEHLDINKLDIKSVDTKLISQKTIYNFLKSGTLSEVDDLVDEYFVGMGEEAIRSIMFRQYVLVESLISSITFLDGLGIDKDKAPEMLGNLSDPVKYIENVDASKNYIKDLLRLMIDYRNQLSDKKYTEIIEKAKKYIQDNYQNDDMSLQFVASSVNVSSNHFSAIFRKETGDTFIDYLTTVRMDKAKDLLTCTSMKTSEIGFEVGYRDPHYFSYIFKKTQGMSPKEYRRIKKES